MFEIKIWMENYVAVMQNEFADNIVCIGLQGSCGRGEADETSDIDVVLILKRLSADDLVRYRETAAKLPERRKLCGFISGEEELKGWFPADLFQLYHDTTPVCGSLDFLLPFITNDSAREAARIGACNLYHACAHNIVHERSGEILRSCYKSAVFTMQALEYERNGKYILRHADLLKNVTGADLEIMRTAMELKNAQEITPAEFDRDSAMLLDWAGAIIRNSL